MYNLKRLILTLVIFCVNVFAYAQNEKLPNFRFSVNSGFSFQILKVNKASLPTVQDYAKELKSGYNLACDLIYYYSEKQGLGIFASTYRSSGELDNFYKDYEGNTLKRKDNISIHFIGGQFSSRFYDYDKGNNLLFNAGIGIMNYNVMIASNEKSKQFSSNGPGFKAELAYDFKITSFLNLGFSCVFNVGYIEYVELEDIRQLTVIKERQAVSWIDFSVGLRLIK